MTETATNTVDSDLPIELPFEWLRLDAARGIVASSPTWAKRFGAPAPACRLDDLIAREDRQGRSNYLAKLNTYVSGYEDVFLALMMDQRTVLTRVRFRREPAGWFAIIDPLDTEDSVRELLEIREHHRSVIRTATEGIAFLDAKHRIFEVNQQFLDVCEFRSKHGVLLNEASIYGRTLSDVADENFQPLVDAFKQELPQQRKFDGRIFASNKTLYACLTPTFLARKTLGGYVLSIKDLSTEEENRKLSELSDALAQANSGLELAVQNRTAALQLVLDHTGDGILSVGLDGQLLRERSASVTSWFGAPETGVPFWEYLAGENTETSELMRLAFEQMVESLLPFHVAAEQAPHRIVRGKSTYSLEYRNVTSETGLDRIVILIRDVTAQLEAEKIEQSTKEFYRLLTNLLQDPDGFRQGIEEITNLMESARSTSNILECKQALHTIKGSCSVVGFRRVAEFVHQLETSIAEYSRLPTETELAELDVLWRNLLLSISDFLPTDATGRIQLESVEYQDLVNLLEIHAPHQEMLAYVQRWPHERVTKQLERLQQHVYRLAKRLDKAIDVRIDDGGVRVEPERLKAFWPTLVHIIRNAVDHGCEPQSERERQGKPPRCLMELSSRQSATQFEISISDDGRGIDWESIRQKAIRLGLAHQSQHDLVEALFTDGLSTRDEATDISGRGIGLHAVRTACADAGGYLHVESTLGKGTTFLFRFPLIPSTLTDTEVRDDQTASERDGEGKKTLKQPISAED